MGQRRRFLGEGASPTVAMDGTAVPLTLSLGALGGKSETPGYAKRGCAGGRSRGAAWLWQAEVMIWALAAAGGLVL